jgi:hypothetical protein
MQVTPLPKEICNGQLFSLKPYVSDKVSPAPCLKCAVTVVNVVCVKEQFNSFKQHGLWQNSSLVQVYIHLPL